MDKRTPPSIGPVLQRHRRLRGLSLEKLANESGISKSMLSQIERGKANPTFAVLWSLTRALHIEFSDLTADGHAMSPEAPVEVVSAAGTPEIRSPDGQCKLRILSPPNLAGAVEWYELEINSGGALISTAHAAGAEEHLTVLAGELSVRSGSTPRGIRAGETARYAADVPHSITNNTRQTARALLVVLYR
jgi:transcriptional regulator with XRE-family HTH domain